MSENFAYDGERIPVVESALTHPTHADGLVDAGDPVIVGALAGVALASAAANTDVIEVATEGVWNLSATGVTATADSAIAAGDKLYYQDAETKASGTLTSDATAPSDGDTVTIGATVYTFKTALTTNPAAVPYEVLIGASAAAALDNLKSAINATAGAGTTYGTGTAAHPTVEATTNTDTTQLVVALAAGADGNAIATIETSSHLSWSATSLFGGSSAGTLTKTAADAGFGVALQAIGAGESAVIPVKIKRSMQ